MIDSWFPTLIYHDVLENHKSRNADYEKRIVEIDEKIQHNSKWNCNTITSYGSYTLKEESLFKDLIYDCSCLVYHFAKEFGVYDKNLKLQDAWYNIAEKHMFQEYHIHPGNHFSLVYYVKAPEDCGNIIFKSPEAATDMFLLPCTELTRASYKNASYKPEESKVLIFRSNLQHMVHINKSDENRISIAMNFILE